MSTLCKPSGTNFTKFPNIKFKPLEIKNFYKYFKKFSNDGDYINIEQFKKSLGILGYNRRNFICERLFELIDKKKSGKISFEKYLEFLNLTNYGSYDEKLKHTFEFFDIQNLGKIEKSDFREVIYELCLYFSSISTTQVKIKKQDIDIIYQEIIEKIEDEELTFENFRSVTIENPEILDFFDIFNNKILEGMTILINKQIIRRLHGLYDSLNNLTTKISEIKKHKNGLTLALSNFVERSIKNKSLIKDGLSAKKSKEEFNYFITDTGNEVNDKILHTENISKSNNKTDVNIKNNNNNKYTNTVPNNKNAEENKIKMFSISKQVENNFFFSDEEEISISESDSDSEELFNKEPSKIPKESLRENFEFNLDKNKIISDKENYNKIEKFTFKEKFSNKNIQVNNINNINNIHIVNNNISDIQNMQNLGNKGNISIRNNLKLNNEMPSIYNFNENDIKSKSVNFKNEKNSSRKNDKEKNPKISLKDTNTEKSSFKRQKTNKFVLEIFDDFEIFSPKIIKNKEFINELKENGIDLEKCLIVSDKNNFMNYLDKIKSMLHDIIFDIDPSEVKKWKKRKGHYLGFNNMKDINKEEFLNSTPRLLQENGMIHFGNKNIELVLTMMIGIRKSINSIGENPELYKFNENNQAFKDFNCFNFMQSNFESEYNCQFFDFAPKVFFNIRHIYGIKNEEYLKSLGPENFLGNLILTKNRSLREMTSAGKSGSFFYYSYDNKFVLKTISTQEFEYFKLIIEKYYFHMEKNQNTLIQRFFGLHTMIFNDIKMHFVIMNNVFNTNYKINYKYDLKGSSYSRMSRSNEDINYQKFDFNIPMKDNDFLDRREGFLLTEVEIYMLNTQTKKDTEFLGKNNINDYSLLIGVHKCGENNNLYEFKHNLIADEISEKFDECKMQKRVPFFEQNSGGLFTSDKNKIIFIAIIDVFTQYGYLLFYYNIFSAKKKMEHFFKGITQGDGISCKPPNEYMERFQNFAKKVWKKG